MPQQPFTPAGIQAKQQELYALSDASLLVQANDIRSNLRSWLTTNFQLDSTQTSFLNSMDAQWIQLTSYDLGFAVQNRLPVYLTSSGTGPGKLVRNRGGLICDFSNTTGFAASGSLTFEVTYS